MGAGKTYAYLREVALSSTSMTHMDVFAPTHILQGEMKAKYFTDALTLHGRASGADDPEKRLCIRAKIAAPVYEAGTPFRASICTGCPLAPGEGGTPRCAYLQQFAAIEDWPTIIATHGHLLGELRLTGGPVKWQDERAMSAVIVDEVVDPFGDDLEFKPSDYSPLQLHFMLATGVNHAAGTVTTKRRVKTHATSDEVAKAIAVVTYVINGGWLPSRDGSYWTPPTELDFRDFIAAVETFKKARLKHFRNADTDAKIKKALESPRGVKRQNMQRLLEHILERHSPQTRTWGVDGEFTVTTMKRPIIDPATSLVVLDATTPVLLTEAIYGREFEVTDLRVKQHIEVRRITGLTGSKASLTGRADTRVEYSDAAPWDQARDDAHMKALLEIYVTFAKGRSLLVVGQMEITEALKEIAGERYPRIVFRHFNSLRGVDDFRDYWGIAVMGYQQTELAKAERQRACFKDVPGQMTMSDWMAENEGHPLHPDGYFRNPDTGASFHPDPLTEAIRWNANEGEILQIIGRLRGVRQKREAAPVQLLVIGDMFIPDLPEPVQTWDWATVLRWGMEGSAMERYIKDAYAKLDDSAPLGRGSMVKISPSIIPNKMAAKSALEDGGDAIEHNATFFYQPEGERVQKAVGSKFWDWDLRCYAEDRAHRFSAALGKRVTVFGVVDWNTGI